MTSCHVLSLPFLFFRKLFLDSIVGLTDPFHPPKHPLESSLSSYHSQRKLSLTHLSAQHKTGDLKLLVEIGLGGGTR